MNELTYTEEPPAGPQNAKRKLFIGLGATVAILEVAILLMTS